MAIANLQSTFHTFQIGIVLNVLFSRQLKVHWLLSLSILYPFWLLKWKWLSVTNTWQSDTRLTFKAHVEHLTSKPKVKIGFCIGTHLTSLLLVRRPLWSLLLCLSLHISLCVASVDYSRLCFITGDKFLTHHCILWYNECRMALLNW